jgi:hypothetical protein
MRRVDRRFVCRETTSRGGLFSPDDWLLIVQLLSQDHDIVRGFNPQANSISRQANNR